MRKHHPLKDQKWLKNWFFLKRNLKICQNYKVCHMNSNMSGEAIFLHWKSWKYQKEISSSFRKALYRILNLAESKIQILNHFIDPKETLMPTNTCFQKNWSFFSECFYQYHLSQVKINVKWKKTVTQPHLHDWMHSLTITLKQLL